MFFKHVLPLLMLSVSGLLVSSGLQASAKKVKTKTPTPKFEQYYNIKYLQEATEIQYAINHPTNTFPRGTKVSVSYDQPPYTAFIRAKKNSTVYVKQGKRTLYHKKLTSGVGFLKLKLFVFQKSIKVYATSANHRKSSVKSYKFKLYDMNK